MRLSGGTTFVLRGLNVNLMKWYSIALTLIMLAPKTTIAQLSDSSVITTETREQKVRIQDESVYKIKPAIEIPITLALDAWSIYGMSVIYGRDTVSAAEILALDRNNVNKFDRPIIDNYRSVGSRAGNPIFYGSMPLPLLFLLDKKIRPDFLKISLMYLEAMGLTGTLYTSSAMIVNRFRPYAYNPDVPMEVRTRGGAKNSFFAGHVAVVGTATFFTAKVFCDYHPNMKCKWVLYTLAGAATAGMGLVRLKAGQHFKTDVITGMIVGPVAGILIPYIHRNRSYNSSKLTLLPNFSREGTGFTAFYKMGRNR